MRTTASTTAAPIAPATAAAAAAVRHPRVAGPVRTRVRWDRVAALLVGLVVFTWAFSALTPGFSQADQPAAPPVTVVVQPGDTLWDLAREHGPAGVATLEYVEVVEDANGVRAGVLVPGTPLVLPQG